MGESDPHLDTVGPSRRLAVPTGHIGALPHILERTALVTSLPKAFAERVVEGRRLHATLHPLDAALPRLRLYLSWHASVQSDAGHTWFREQVARALDR